MSSLSEPSLSDLAARDHVDLGRILDELSDGVSALARGAPAHLSAEQLSAAVGSIAQLFAACAQRAGRTDLISGDDVSTTDVVTLVEGLLAAQNLNVFDLALWLSRSRAERTGGKEPGHDHV